MSVEPEKDIKRDDPLIAAEWALGLLEGEELLAARGKHAVDPDFAWRKEWWDNWFAPLADEMPAAEPAPQVWERIARAIDTPAPGSAEVITLQTKVRRWQLIAAFTSAAAAVGLMVNVIGPTFISPKPATQTTPLVASVPIGDAGLKLEVTFLAPSEQMLVSATGLAADGVHDHELWLVPDDGSALQSLGVIAPGEVRSMVLPAKITRKLGNGAALVLTREPIGGKPEGAEAGPVVARGAFAPV